LGLSFAERRLKMAEERAPQPQPFVVDARIRQMIAGAVAEVDLAQIARLRLW